jgi:hypothetical protein
MRAPTFGLLTLFLAATAAGCGDDPPPFFADALWQVQCRCYGMCSGIPIRDVQHLDGETGMDTGRHAVNCSVDDRAGTNVLTANVFNDDGFGFEIRGAEFSGAGGPVSGVGCQVTVREGGNTYVGPCSANPPTVGQPCRISSLLVNNDMDGNRQVEGDLLCFHLESTADSSIRREFARPNLQVMGGGMGETCMPTGESEPVHFRFVNCGGI